MSKSKSRSFDLSGASERFLDSLEDSSHRLIESGDAEQQDFALGQLGAIQEEIRRREALREARRRLRWAGTVAAAQAALGAR